MRMLEAGANSGELWMTPPAIVMRPVAPKRQPGKVATAKVATAKPGRTGRGGRAAVMAQAMARGLMMAPLLSARELAHVDALMRLCAQADVDAVCRAILTTLH